MKNLSDRRKQSELGHLYQRYWGRWLRDLCRHLGLEARGNPVPHLEAHAAKVGPIPLLKAARILAGRDHFEPVSYAVLNAGSLDGMVERWLAIAEMQNRLGPQDHVSLAKNGITMIPSASPLAAGSLIGPVILIGASWGLFERWGLQIEQVRIEGNEKSYLVDLNGVSVGVDHMLDRDNLWYFKCLNDESRINQSACFDLSFFEDGNSDLAGCLEKAWNGILIEGRGPGHHISQNEMSGRLGITPRSLSRYMSNAGFSWREMAPALRFKSACQRMKMGQTCQEEIAFLSGYSDRHHMARDFRALAGISPGKYLEVMNI